MPPLTRSGSRRAAASGFSPVQPAPPGAASPSSPILSSSTRLDDLIGSSCQPAVALDSFPPRPTAIPPSLILDASTCPSDSSTAASSHQQPVITPRSILMDITRQSVPSPPKHRQPSWAMGITSVKGIADPTLRDQVDRLQQLHPWAPTKLCLSMIMGCRVFGDANDALRKYAVEVSDDEDDKIAVKSVLSSQKSQVTMSDVTQSLPTDRDSMEVDRPTTLSSSFPGKVFNAGGLSTSITVATSKKNGWKSKAGSKVKSNKLLAPFSKPMQSPSSIFSQAARQRAIASSTETDLDRQRAAFVADALLYKSFSGPDYHNYGQVTKYYYPRFGLKHFPNSSGPFSQSTNQNLSSRNSFKGTDRGIFRPLPYNSIDGRITLQSINLGFPYLNVSFEELRFGDWIRGRTKAPHLFDVFPKLPPEIRCMIWGYAMTPRVVELRHNSGVTETWSVAKIPITLHVCRESRYEALKRYTLAFGIRNSPDQTYFDFQRDTLFLTYEKDSDQGEYEGGLCELTYLLGQSEETKKVRSLAVDEELLSLWAQILEDEEDDWDDIGDDDMPEPELEVVPDYESLQSLVIVRTKIDGFWSVGMTECSCGHCAPGSRKRMIKNNNAEFVPVNAYNVVNGTRQEYYKQLVTKIKLGSPSWSIPELSYMIKRAPKSSDPD